MDIRDPVHSGTKPSDPMLECEDKGRAEFFAEYEILQRGERDFGSLDAEERSIVRAENLHERGRPL